VVIYGAEAWSPRRKEEELLERKERVSLQDKKARYSTSSWSRLYHRQDKGSNTAMVRLRWYGHAQRTEDDSYVKVTKAEVYRIIPYSFQ